MLATGRRGVLRAVVITIVLVALFAWSDGPTTGASPGGLQNLGFEEGILDAFPVDWNVVEPVPDAVVVVDQEGPAEFQTYAAQNITVTPFIGDLMLRLGTPKRIAESQNRNQNAVFQTFQAERETLKFAFRVFSWEHRGNDVVGFSLTDPNGGLSVTMSPDVPAALAGGCSSSAGLLSCEYSVDVGKRKQFLASEWIEVEITGLQIGVSYTLTYSAGGSKNDAHATWAYFDNVNTPPVAKFTFAPDDPLEGDGVQFIDLSEDPDLGDRIVSWEWNIDGETFTSQDPFFIFADEGEYDASLTVTDTDGASTTVADGGTATDGTDVPRLEVVNADPLVNALNIEALEGQETLLVGRFLDPGWEDTHTATLSLDGLTPEATLDEENEPLLSSGRIIGAVTPTTSLSGTLTVDDGDGGIGFDDFQVTLVLDDDPQRHEPNNTIEDIEVSEPLFSDNAYLSYIQEAGDIDLFEVRLEDGSTLGAGDELLVTLANLPADYDVAILTQSPEEATTGWARVGWARVGWARVGWARVDSSILGWARVGWARVGWARVGWARVDVETFNTSGASWANLGWARVGWARVGWARVGEVTPIDIKLEELGLGSIEGADIEVADFSANRGLDDEVAWAQSPADGTRFFVAVFGGDAHSTEPYTLGMEVIEAADLEVDLSAVCTDQEPLVPTPHALEIVHNYDDPATPGVDEPARTLFVTQRERFEVLYGEDAWNAMLSALADLAQHDAVQGDIISVPSDIYDSWDESPCSIDAANDVAAEIRSIIEDRLDGIENVVLVGSDQIVPFRRVPDQTIIGNERDYLLDSFLQPGSPLFASVLQSEILTDDYYVDDVPNSWQGRELYIPDRPIGRLAETPGEISAAAEAFLLSDGTLNPATGFVSGYDFFIDGSEDIADTLDDNLSGDVERLINDGVDDDGDTLVDEDPIDGIDNDGDTLIDEEPSWTADDLRCGLLGQGSDASCGVRDVNSPNAHFTHYAALSAAGFTTENYDDVVGSDEVASAEAPGDGVPALDGAIVFLMGCHAGFNVPDGSSSGPDEGLGIDPALDFVQAMAMQRAIYLASTGYAYGDDEGIGGTERLMGLFAEALVQGDITAGEALVSAKQDYLSSLSTMTVYDEKSSTESTLYGLPMYQVLTGIVASSQPLETQETGSSFELTTVDSLATEETRTVTSSHILDEVTTDAGTYFTADGDAQATPGRAIQPRVASDLDERGHVYPTDPPPVHGVLVTGGTFEDIALFDPRIARLTLEWEIGEEGSEVLGEPQECVTGLWPSEVARVNSLEGATSELDQTLVVLFGQFRCTDSGPPVIGIERLDQSLTVQLLRSESDDLDPPVIDSVALRSLGGGIVEVSVDADDLSGIAQIVVLLIGDGEITSTSLDIDSGEAGPFTVTVPGAADKELVVQVVDAAGNVTTWTAKAVNLSVIEVDAGPDQVYGPGIPVTLTATVFGFTELTPPVFFDWSFGDGTSLTGRLAPEALRTVDVQVDADGNATFTVQHTYSAEAPWEVEATLTVTDSAGGTGADDVHLRRCGDPVGDSTAGPDSDLVECGVNNTSATNMAITLRVAGAITDEFQYRVYLDIGTFDENRQLVSHELDGVPDLNLRYDRGNVTGLPSLQAFVNANELRFEFDLADVGWSGDHVQWFAETQAGVQANPATGKPDRMPDSGFFGYVLR